MPHFCHNKIILFLFVIPILIVTDGCSPLYQEPPSDHFNGKRFFNAEPTEHGFGKMLKWLWEMKTVGWPDWIEDQAQPKPLEWVTQDHLRATYINQATVLIQMDGLNILTDPIWSKQAGPLTWLGSKRIRRPGINLEDLPKIDVVLISHDHYDHLDLATLKQLSDRFQPLILTGLGCGAILKANGIERVIEMDWWQEQQLPSGGLKCIFVPAQHTSGRIPFRNDRTLWGGFVLEAPAGRIYFAGDTGYGRFLEEIRNRFAGFQLTIFPIGSYEKRWFMKDQHMNPDDAVRAHLLLHSQQSLGIHFATFKEHPEQTIDAHEKDLCSALEQHRLPASAFWILKFGEARDIL